MSRNIEITVRILEDRVWECECAIGLSCAEADAVIASIDGSLLWIASRSRRMCSLVPDQEFTCRIDM